MQLIHCMKTLLIYLSVFMLSSCSGLKSEATGSKTVMPPPQINCPEGGDCSFEVFENSSLTLTYSDRGKLNRPEVVEGNQIVIKYRYKRKEQKDALDSSYSEYIYFEIDPGQQDIVLRDLELKKVKMTFGRICYCKGAMGYFPVEQGQLMVFNKNGNLQVRSTFKVKKIPQIITEIDENINY